MTPITYRIPITAYVINNEEAPERNALQTLEGIRKHLYLAANIAYQHYYQLLAKEDPVQKNLFEKYNKFQKADEEAWKNLNDAKLRYHHLQTSKEKEEVKSIIEKLPDKIREIRNDAKKSIYDFVKQDEFIAKLTDKFRNVIPREVMQYSMTKVLQELYTDYPNIQDENIRQPLRVYSNNFPICFGWNNDLKNSFKFLDKKGSGEKTVQFYSFRCLDKENELIFRCRIGKRLSELADLLAQISIGAISYTNIGDPSIQYNGKNKWVLQFTYKPPGSAAITSAGNDKLAMGIDLGYKVPISWAITDDNNTSGEIGGIDEIKEERKKIQALFKKKIAAIKNTRSGRGRSRKNAILKDRNVQEGNYFGNLNACWAHKLVKIAVDHNVAIIKIEDLDFRETKKRIKQIAKQINLQLAQRGTKKEHKSQPDNLLTMFRNWSYADLINRIEKEAEQHKIMVARVHPYKTSKICWKCEKEGKRNTQAHLRFTREQANQCSYKQSGECVLIPYDEKVIARQRKKAVKNGNSKGGQAQQVFTHYLMADQNAAMRIAWAQQYHLTPKQS